MNIATMKRSILAPAVMLLLACGAEDHEGHGEVGAQVAAQSDAPAALDRASLSKHAEAFLAALRTSTASTLLGEGAQATENGQKIALDKSLCAGARAYPYHVVFADPARATAGIFAVADVGESPLVLSARLKITGSKISEVEIITARPGEASVAAPERLTSVHPMYETTLEPSARSTSDELIAAANAYFDGIETSSAAKVPFADDCIRFENGAQTTGAVGGPSPVLALGCREQVPYLEYIEHIRDRRYPLVDEARGLVWGLAVFDIPGGTYRQVFPDGQVVERVMPPRSILISEMFKVVGGRIQRIEVVMRNAPLGVPSGW
jgi:hypothetical protein